MIKWFIFSIVFGLLSSLISCPQDTPAERPPVLPTPGIHVEPDEGYSIARNWNEMLLEAIRNDRARPPVHARNLFHAAVAMYDAWAVFDELASPYLLGNTLNGYECSFSGFNKKVNQSLEEARATALSYASYRLLKYRFGLADNFEISIAIDQFFDALGYDPNNNNLDYQEGDAAALGNYIARCMILSSHHEHASFHREWCVHQLLHRRPRHWKETSPIP